MAKVLDPASIGPMFFSPGQAYFRQQAQGYDADMSPGVSTAQPGVAHAPMNRLQIDDTGGVDAEVLEPTDSGWLDIGGAPGTVVPMRSAWS